MKKRIFLSIVVAVMTAILSFSIIGCNSTKNVEENKQNFDDSVKLDISDEVSSIDAPLRLSSNGFVVNEDGSLSTTVTATVKPARLSESTYLYWTIYDEANVPTEGFDWGTLQGLDGVIELIYSNESAVATHSCNIFITNAFKGKTYKLRCSSLQEDYVGLDVEIPIIYDGAPSSYDCNNGTTISGSKFVLTEQAEELQFDFDYSNYFDVLGVNYDDQSPQIMLDSVTSKYTVGVNTYDIYMLFKYSAVTSGYVYLRLADYYDLFINDNLTPSDTLQPVSSSFNISATKSPDNLNILFEEIKENGVLSDFEGYYINPEFSLGLHYFDQKQAGTKIDHEEAYLTFNLNELNFGNFALKFRVEPILSGLELGADEILI